MEKSANILDVYERFIDGLSQLERHCDFMHTQHLGFIVSCPSNLGTAIRAGSLVKLPLLSARGDFSDLCKKAGL